MAFNLAQVSPFDAASSSANAVVGVRYEKEEPELRVWHYAEDGGSGVDRGKLAVQADITSNHVDLNFASAPSAGDDSVTVTLGGTAITADDYKNGWLVVENATGEGRAYAIEGNPAQTSTTGDVTIDLAEQIDTAGAASEGNVDLIQNRYKDIQISNTDQSDVPVGVPTRTLSASEFGFIQTWGPCAVWQDESTGIGDMIVTGDNTAGQISTGDAAGEPLVGFQGPTGGAAADYQLVYLRLDP